MSNMLPAMTFVMAVICRYANVIIVVIEALFYGLTYIVGSYLKFLFNLVVVMKLGWRN